MHQFQSTLPVRGATYPKNAPFAESIFQSTLPVRGATLSYRSFITARHNFNPRSPCGERPSQDPPGAVTVTNFNPRSPCGERLAAQKEKIALTEFQSTLPVRGATPHVFRTRAELLISIHAPRAGSDRVDRLMLVIITEISIHAPRAGSDGGSEDEESEEPKFQSTLPVRGATARVSAFGRLTATISIHAPRAGSDTL